MDPRQYSRPDPLRRAVALLALTTALVRALIPVGFMPASVQGTVELVFCNGGGHHPTGGSPADHNPAGHHGADQGPCPFALSGAAPFLPEALAGTRVAAAVEAPAASAPLAALRAAPLRYSTPRGPPARA